MWCAIPSHVLFQVLASLLVIYPHVCQWYSIKHPMLISHNTRHFQEVSLGSGYSVPSKNGLEMCTADSLITTACSWYLFYGWEARMLNSWKCETQPLSVKDSLTQNAKEAS